MNRIRTYIFVSSVMLLLSVLSLQGFDSIAEQTPDPHEIVRKAASAVKNIKAIEYDAVYSGYGAMANYPSYTGRVALQRISTPFGQRGFIAVCGNGSYPGEVKARIYAHSYNGETVRWLDHKSRSIIERVILSVDLDDKSWGTVTGHLGRAGASTILWELLSEEPFSRTLGSALLEYQGAIAVEGELCHVIYQEDIHPVTKRKRAQQWYISEGDFLPRRQESLSNLDGRIGVLVLTLSRLRVSEALTPDTFEINAPGNYSTTVYQAEKKKVDSLLEGATAPAWSVADSTGKIFALNDLKGKVVVLDFWAEWCVPCKQAMPVLQRLHEKYCSRGVTVIGVHCFPAKGGKQPMDYIRLKEYTYRQITEGDEIARDYKVTSLPTLYVIDQSGKIAFHHIGFKQNLETDLIQIIDILIDD